MCVKHIALTNVRKDGVVAEHLMPLSKSKWRNFGNPSRARVRVFETKSAFQKGSCQLQSASVNVESTCAGVSASSTGGAGWYTLLFLLPENTLLLDLCSSALFGE